MDEQSMSLTISFNDPGAISSDIAEPDLLMVKFLLPGLFIDA